jgi:large subunit ribosomal protein L25
MSEMKIEVQKRERTGKGANRQARSGGLIPAVVYGGGKESIAIQVDRKSMLDMLKKTQSENPIFLLNLGDKERHAMIRDMHVHPISRQVLHIDFQRVLMDQKVRVQVPIELTGVAYGVKTQGGVLDFVTRELQIDALPNDIPNHLVLDITDLHVGQHVEAGALQLPNGVTLHDDAEKVICAISHARAEEPGAEGTTRDEPEVVKKGKTDEA